MSTTNNHNHQASDDDDDNSNDEQEEEMNILEQVQGLFSTEIFPNVLDMFRVYQPQFDLQEFLRKHQIVSQYDYIRLINYIRCEVIFLYDIFTKRFFFSRNLRLIF
jgi:hypothetical protein